MKYMKRMTTIIFCMFLYVSSFTGCAGSGALIKDNRGKVEAAASAPAAPAAVTPAAVDVALPARGAAAIAVPAPKPSGTSSGVDSFVPPAQGAGLKAGGMAAKSAEKPAAAAAAVPEKGADVKSGSRVANAAKRLAEKKAYMDKSGRLEITSTPFGYVKREKKQTGPEAGAPPSGQQETVVPLVPVVETSASVPAVPPPLAVAESAPAPADTTSASAPEGDAPAAASVLTPAALPPLQSGTAPPLPAPPEKAELNVHKAELSVQKTEPHVQKPPERKPAERAGQISFDFDAADLYAVIKVMADYLKINYIIDPGVSGKVTIHTAGHLKGADVFPVFYQTLEVNGLTAVKEGNVYRISKIKDAARMPISFRLLQDAKDLPPEERIVLQIIPLQFISAPEAATVITPFVSAEGTIIAEGGSNTLLVVDKGINILKVLRLAEGFDVSVFERLNYRFYNFKNASAEDASKTLGEILALSPSGSKNDVKFIPIKWLNALLVVSSSPDVFLQVEGLINQLDIPSEGAQPQIYVYSVKNGMAAELGDILRAIFGKGGEIKTTATKESVPTNPFAKGVADKKLASTATKAGTPFAATNAPAAATPAATTKPAAAETTGASTTLRGDIKITSDPIRNALIIEAIPGDYKIVERILERLDILPRQVLIEVFIAEITLGEGTDLGIEWTFKKDNWAESGSLAATIGAAGLNYTLGLSQKWQTALHALANESRLNVLSSPSVLASDNKQARIDVTKEVPIPSTNYTIVTSGENVLETKIEYRNTGVILDVTPHINEYGLVTMDISQEVSSVGELLKVAGQDYYSFNNRKILTSLTVKHNQSIVIGGLISKENNDASSGVPWFVKVPILRWLFGTEKKSESKSELIVMITPHVINSLDDVDAVREEFTKKMENALKKYKIN